ncbi:MAG: patatin-like phospholipase family protein [Burkholderiales bacterium]
MLNRLKLLGWMGILLGMLAACSAPPVKEAAPVVRAPKIALVLGGGAARGFAHVGVIKVLESHGIVPDMVVGTSAGSVVGALYAGGYGGYDLQKIALQLDQDSVGDFALPDRGFIKGELLQDFINRALRNRPIEKLPKTFCAVATDLRSGELMAFQRGNTGMAVRASSSVPGVFQPVKVGGREYVDGGLVSPVPVSVARKMGADIVIAVDIAAKPARASVGSTVDILLQTFAVMMQGLSRYELEQADVVIRPKVGGVGAAEFEQKNLAIMEGEKAALAALPLIQSRLRRWADQGGAPR